MEMTSKIKTIRLKKFQKRLIELEIDVAFLILSRDIFYYTGTALRDISDNVISSLQDGIKCSEIFDKAYARASQLGVAEYYLGLAPRKGNFVGHGIGLDANEPPILFAKSNFELKSNFVVTIEIHLTHPEHGAVKLEDMILIKKNGCEILSVTEREMFVV